MSKFVEKIKRDIKENSLEVILVLVLTINTGIIASLILSNHEKQTWIDAMTDKIYSQDQKISHYEKLIEKGMLKEEFE